MYVLSITDVKAIMWIRGLLSRDELQMTQFGWAYRTGTNVTTSVKYKAMQVKTNVKYTGFQLSQTSSGQKHILNLKK